jgi:hypothetical protein
MFQHSFGHRVANGTDKIYHEFHLFFIMVALRFELTASYLLCRCSYSKSRKLKNQEVQEYEKTVPILVQHNENPDSSDCIVIFTSLKGEGKMVCL